MKYLKNEKNIELINKEIDSCKSLEQLFDIWKKAHINDNLYKYDTPEKNGRLIKIDSFIEDGFCVTDRKDKGSILYISKESNSFTEDNVDIMQEPIYNHLSKCKKENHKTTFARRIFEMQAMAEEILNIENDNITFMNLNKRGGFKSTNMSILNVYALEFGNYIIKEIEIISPKVIVCCGDGIKKMIEMIYQKNNKICKVPLIEVKHPSYWRISDDEYMKLFIEKLTKIC